MKEDNIKTIVRKGYADVAKKEQSCCGSTISEQLGYSKEELESVPQGADLSLGCGNPVALASLKEGETVLDLGSGGGLDCFLAANKVGEKGKVIGVDMTPEMLDKARANAQKTKHKNVEFRLGEIENLPVADNTVDIVISNCVINLSPDKKRVFKEAFRVLKPGGRIMISDIVLLKQLPEIIKKSVKAYIGCLSGAILKNKYIEAIKEAGFQQVKILGETHFPVKYMANDPNAKTIMADAKIPVESVKGIAASIVSVKVYGEKPKS
jgi:SAM-dependent methyltransferase